LQPLTIASSHPACLGSVTGAWFEQPAAPAHAAPQQRSFMSDQALESRLARLLGRDLARTAIQFLRFGVVGTIGFIVDTGVLYLGLALGLGLYSGRALSYVVAASANWALNRAWTFRGQGDAPALRQWVAFLVVNLVGFACNYGTYAALVAGVPLVAEHPVLGVAAGSLAGMVGNFLLSRRFVFGGAPRAPSP
jgi:putative flippase GtrA